jgi:hypothetical protein
VLAAAVQTYRDNKREAKLARVAAPVVTADLGLAAEALTRIRDKNIVVQEEIPGPLESWERYREVLANRLTLYKWLAASEAVGELGRVSLELPPLLPEHGVLPAPSDDVIASVTRASQAVTKAAEGLAPAR